MNKMAFSPLFKRLPPGLEVQVAKVEDCLRDLSEPEQALVSNAIASRRAEFSSTRKLAHQMLERLGFPKAPLLINPDRSPAWPKEVLGSLSHSRAHCAVALCDKKSEILGVGIDIEDQRPIKTKMFAEILTPQELERLQRFTPEERHSEFVLRAFTVKEALYKAMHPIGNEGLGFHAMETDFRADSTRPRVLPMADLQRRLPQGCKIQAHHHRHGQTYLSVVIVQP